MTSHTYVLEKGQNLPWDREREKILIISWFRKTWNKKNPLRCNSIIWRQNYIKTTQWLCKYKGKKHINTQDKFLQIKINHTQVRHSEIVAQTVTHVNSDIEDTITRVAAQQKWLHIVGLVKLVGAFLLHSLKDWLRGNNGERKKNELFWWVAII